MYYLQGGRTFPEAVVVASERLDADKRWREVPDRHPLHVDGESGATLRPL